MVLCSISCTLFSKKNIIIIIFLLIPFISCAKKILFSFFQLCLRVLWWPPHEAAGRCQQPSRFWGGLQGLPPNEETGLLKPIPAPRLSLVLPQPQSCSAAHSSQVWNTWLSLRRERRRTYGCFFSFLACFSSKEMDKKLWHMQKHPTVA